MLDLYEYRRCRASACVPAKLARDDVELGSEGHAGVAVWEGSRSFEHRHLLALVVYRGEYYSLVAVDGDVVIEVVDDEWWLVDFFEFAGVEDYCAVGACC